MNAPVLLSVLAVSGTLLLVATGLLNFSVFLRQLRSTREQLATSEHPDILVGVHKSCAEGDRATSDEVKAMAELLLDNLASAIIHSAAFPQYPIRGVEQTFRFHLRHSPPMCEFLSEAFDRFPLAGLALLSLKERTKAQIGTTCAD